MISSTVADAGGYKEVILQVREFRVVTQCASATV